MDHQTVQQAVLRMVQHKNDEKRGMALLSLARLITKVYKWIIVAWVVLAIIMGFLAIRLPSILEGDGFNMDAEHARVMERATAQFGIASETMFIVFEHVDDEQIEASIAKVDALDLASDITSPLVDASLYTDELSYALLHFDHAEHNMSDVVSQIREAIDGDEGVMLTGQSAISKDISSASQRDLLVAEGIGLPIAIIVLLLAFGTVVASLIPLIVGLSAVIVSFGIMSIIGQSMDLSVFILNIVPMLGLALSIDFALLFISRFREERKKKDMSEAITTTIQTAGRAIIFSAFCVFIGLGAMFLIKVDIFRDIAVGGMLIVTGAVLSSITLLPAILIALGERVNKWRLIRVKANGADRWRKFAHAVIKRPVTITIIATVLLCTALLPVVNMELKIPQIDALPESYESREAYELINDTFSLDTQSPVYVIATRENGWDDLEGLSLIKRFEDHLTEQALVDEVMTIYALSGIDSPEMWEQMWQSPMGAEQLSPLWESFVQAEDLFVPITLTVDGSSEEAQNFVRQLADSFPDMDFIVGGQAKFNQEIFDEISDKIILVVSVIMISTFIVLMVAFRSLIIPLKAIFMNVIGLAATFGILVYIFQYGHFGLTPGTIALIIPAIVFSLVFGLSMDYEVFLISRMQEEYDKTGDNDHATVEGLAMTSKIITSAALIMIVLTGAFAIADVMPVKQIGVGIAIAVAIDASIIRLLLVPSLMKLFGKWNWWLPFSRRR